MMKRKVTVSLALGAFILVCGCRAAQNFIPDRPALPRQGVTHRRDAENKAKANKKFNKDVSLRDSAAKEAPHLAKLTREMEECLSLMASEEYTVRESATVRLWEIVFGDKFTGELWSLLEKRYEEIGDLEVKTRLQSVVSLIRLARAPEMEAKEAVIDFLRDCDGLAAVAVILEMFRADRDPKIRKSAARALGQMGGEKGLQALKASMFGDDSQVRSYVIKVLAETGASGIAETLKTALADDDESVRMAAIKALGKLGTPDAAEALADALEVESKEERAAAMEALREIGSRAPARVLAAALLNRDPAVRIAASKMLRNRPDKGALAALIHALRDPNHEVVENAVSALMQIPDTRTVAPLVRALKRCELGWHRANVIQALAKLGPDARKPLIELLCAPHASVRADAARVLGELRDRGAAGHLVGALKDSSHSVRGNAAEALGTIGERETVLPLIEALGDRDSFVRKKASFALGLVGDERAIKPLIRLLNDPVYYVGEQASLALGGMSHLPVAEPLIEMLKNENARTRRLSVEALSTILSETRDERVLTSLVDALGDSSEGVRSAAAGALAQSGGLAVEPLLGALTHKKACVRRIALMVLAEDSDERATRTVCSLLEDGAGEVRQAAVKALCALAERDMVELALACRLLAGKLKDSSPAVKTTAAESLVELAQWEDLDVQQFLKPLLSLLDDGNLTVRRAALRQLAELAENDILTPSQMFESLSRALKDRNPSIRMAAVDAFMESVSWSVEPSEIFKLAGRILDTESCVQMRARVVECLSGLSGEEGFEPELLSKLLKKGLDDRSPFVRMAAVRVVAEFEPEAAIPTLCERLSDPSARVRRAAMEALSEMEDPAYCASTGPALIEALTSHEPEFLASAARLLAGLDVKDVIEPLMASYERLAAIDPDSTFNQESVSDAEEAISYAIEQLVDYTDVDFLILKLGDRSERIRALSGELLMSIMEEEEQDEAGQILYALQEGSPRVRRGLIRLLYKYYEDSYVAPLLGALDDKDKDIRKAAYEIVAHHMRRMFLNQEHFPQHVTDALALILTKGNAANRRRAVEYLRFVGHYEPARAYGALIEALRDEDAQVREDAAVALGVLADEEFLDDYARWKQWYDDLCRRNEHAERLASEER